jgi:hypothetical protein
MEPIRIPFRLKGLYGGCAKLDGLVILSPEHLTLEYRMTDTIVGAFSGGVTTRTIAWEDIERADCGLGFFMPWLTLAARRLSVFDKLPCKDPSRLRLRIPWGHRRQLQALTSEINMHLSFLEADRLRGRVGGSAGQDRSYDSRPGTARRDVES